MPEARANEIWYVESNETVDQIIRSRFVGEEATREKHQYVDGNWYWIWRMARPEFVDLVKKEINFINNAKTADKQVPIKTFIGLADGQVICEDHLPPEMIVVDLRIAC